MPDEAALQRLIDRQDIVDCLMRYARGVDRNDWELMASAYHDDAMDDHGYFVGRGKDLVKWSEAYRKQNPHVVILRHVLSNHTIDFDGADTAHVETYWTNDVVVPGDEPKLRTSIGRYVDRFERREGQWRIAARVVVAEASATGEGALFDASAGFDTGSRDKNDISYKRPLTITRPVTESLVLPDA